MSPEPPEHADSADRRSWLERAGLGAVALLIAIVFGGLAIAAWSEGEIFLSVMSGIGALMTVWAAAASVLRA